MCEPEANTDWKYSCGEQAFPSASLMHQMPGKAGPETWFINSPLCEGVCACVRVFVPYMIYVAYCFWHWGEKWRWAGRLELCSRKHTHTHTLMEMRTDLTAVPHAGLGYHFLRVQVDQANSIDDHATG